MLKLGGEGGYPSLPSPDKTDMIINISSIVLSDCILKFTILSRWR